VTRLPSRSLTVVALLLAPVVAPAQEARAEVAPGPPTLKLEPMQSGFVVAPESRLSELDGSFASFAGGYAGFLTDDTLLIGAGGYWLTNDARDRSMAYGGLVAELRLIRERRVGLSLRALVGGGSATLGVPVTVPGLPRLPFRGRFGDRPDPGSEPVTRTLRAREGFLVAEPQATLSVRVTSWLRLSASAGYRFAGGADLLGDRLGGASGSFALELGAF
jgi:hypothetical protein